MDPYTFLLILGGAGLAAMALQGIGGGLGHGHSAGQSGHGGHGHGTAGHGHAAHAGHAGHATHGHAGRDAQAGRVGNADLSHGPTGLSHFLWNFASPRVLFSICLGAGALGPFLRPLMGSGTLLLIAAIGAGIIFERVLATPIWNLAFRFVSKPALMLESCVDDEGTAVTSFDKNGQGLIAVDLDGQVVQLLATLQSDDRALGAAVRAGDRVRIAAVDAARNRCTVAAL
jgi:hypothetical protein